MDQMRQIKSKYAVLGGILVIVVGFLLGYAAALPERQAVAPVKGEQVSVISVRDTSSTLYKITGEYPQFPGASTAFNASIANFVEGDISQFKNDAVANNHARIATMPAGTHEALLPQSFYVSVTWEPTQINERYLSLVVRVDYYDGGANETDDLQTFNYDMATGKAMTLASLFPNVPSYLSQIAKLSAQELTSSLNESSNGNVPTSMIQDGTAPTASNYANFVFDDDTVTIYFPKYQVAPGVFGEQEVRISRVTITNQ